MVLPGSIPGALPTKLFLTMNKNAKEAAKEAAFARPKTDLNLSSLGLTKREYFAAMALQGILANQTTFSPDDKHSGDPFNIANDSVKLADALLEALYP